MHPALNSSYLLSISEQLRFPSAMPCFLDQTLCGQSPLQPPLQPRDLPLLSPFSLTVVHRMSQLGEQSFGKHEMRTQIPVEPHCILGQAHGAGVGLGRVLKNEVFST